MSEYQPLKWQIVTDEAGYQAIFETNEDGVPGDLVANVFGDNAALIMAAPALLAACRALDDFWSLDWEAPHPDPEQQEPRFLTKETLEVWRLARAALRLAQPKEVDRGE